jgi:hypothetical protein
MAIVLKFLEKIPRTIKALFISDSLCVVNSHTAITGLFFDAVNNVKYTVSCRDKSFPQ